MLFFQVKNICLKISKFKQTILIKEKQILDHKKVKGIKYITEQGKKFKWLFKGRCLN